MHDFSLMSSEKERLAGSKGHTAEDNSVILRLSIFCLLVLAYSASTEAVDGTDDDRGPMSSVCQTERKKRRRGRPPRFHCKISEDLKSGEGHKQRCH